MKPKLTAAEAIKEAASQSRVPEPPKEALAELKKICEHNDAQVGTYNRVKFETAIEILQAHGWTGCTWKALNALCAKKLGRRSYAKP